MPELPEVEIVIRSISLIEGKIIKKVEVYKENILKSIKKEDFIFSLKGQNIKEIKRKGKNIFFILDKYVLINHLRMTGKYFFDICNVNLKSLAVKFIFEDGFELFFCDYRNFATFHLQNLDNYKELYPYNSIGLDLIDDPIDSENIFRIFEKKKIPIKSSLLEQKIISGIGNIYASEILFDVKINPLKSTNLLTKNEVRKIIDSSRRILLRSIELGGSSIVDFVNVDNKKGKFQNELKVYGRLGKECFSCDRKISMVMIDNRSTYFCSICQIF